MRRFFPGSITLLFLSSVIFAQRSPQIAMQTGHVEPVASACFSSDGKYILSGTYMQMKLWDAASGREIRTFSGHSEHIGAVAFSPDGRYALSGAGRKWGLGKSTDNTLKLWDIYTGEELESFEGHSGPVLDARFLPDGKSVLSASQDGSLKLWDVDTAEVKRTFAGHTGRIECVSLSADGRLAASAGYDKTVRLWDIQTGAELKTFKGHSLPVSSVSLSPDGSRILSGGYASTPEGELKLWDVRSGKELLDIPIAPDSKFSKNGVASVCFHPKGRYAAVATADRLIRIYDVGRGKEVKRLKGHTDGISEICFSPDGSRILSGSMDKTLRIWDIRDGKTIQILTGHTYWINSVDFSPDSSRILLGTGSLTGPGELRVWDLQRGREVNALKGHTSRVRSARFSQDGGYALSGSVDNTVRLWDLNTGQMLAVLGKHSRGVDDVCFSHDGRYAVSGSSGVFNDPADIKLFDLKERKQIRKFTGPSQGVNSLSLSPDGALLLTGSNNGTLRFYDVHTGEETRYLSGHLGEVRSVCFSPDGKRALSAGFDKTVKLWDVASGRVIRSFEGNTDRVECVCFSPDGNYGLAGGWDGRVMLLDLSSGREVRSFEGHSFVVWDVCVSPDGRYGLSGSADGTAKLWDLSTGQCVVSLFPFAWVEKDKWNPWNRKVVQSEWAAVTPEGYFDASTGGAKQTYFVDGLRILSLQQLADLFYKPRLLPRLLAGEGFDKSINVSSVAYPPELEIELVRRGNDRVELAIDAYDTAGGIEDLSLFQNNRIVKAAISSQTQTSTPQKIRFTASVDLLPESNTFYAMAYSRDRVKSFSNRVSAYSELQNNTPRELYLVAVGIDDYSCPALVSRQRGLVVSGSGTGVSASSAKEEAPVGGPAPSEQRTGETKFSNLYLALKDAKDFLSRYSEVRPKEYNILHTNFLSDEKATKKDILNALEEISKKTDSNDRVVLYLSGHGYATQREYGKVSINTYYYVPYDYESLERLPATGLSSIDLMSSLAVDRAGQIFLLLDTCQSGGAEESFANDMFGSLRLFGEDTGIFVMASSASSESSLELESLENGLFTHVLLKQLRRNSLPSAGLWFTEAAQRIGEEMRGIVYQETGGLLSQTLVATEEEDAILAQP